MTSPDDADALIGKKCGNYTIEASLGAGGMGTVYAARHPTLGKRVAIKVLKPELANERKAVGRLIDEARATTAIGHRNIVEVFDIGETDDGLTYVAMEILEGETLGDLLERRGRLEPAHIVGIARQICAALDAAHRQGIIHRDLKPQNVFLVPGRDGPDQVKVLDFGAAKLLDAFNRASPATATGAIIGTPFFMAPEQALGETVDGRTDIYALGVILFRALTGTLPFKGPTCLEILARLLTEDVPTLSEAAPEVRVPEDLERTIMTALSKDLDDRQADMGALDLELARFEARAAPVAPPAASPEELGTAETVAMQKPPSEQSDGHGRQGRGAAALDGW